MNDETMERQIDTLSQAVELLLQRTEAQVSADDAKVLRGLRDELLLLRTERVKHGGAEVPESLQPPFENVRPYPAVSADEDRR